MQAVAFSSGSHGRGLGVLARRTRPSSSPSTNWNSAVDVLQRLVELGVDQQHPGAGVLDDVAHLVGAEPEVHRHQHPAGAADAEERREQPGAVVADDRDPVADLEPELVEPRGLPPGQGAELGVRQLAQGRRGLVGLVDDADPVAVHLHGAVDEVRDAERDDHAATVATGRRDESPLIDALTAAPRSGRMVAT